MKYKRDDKWTATRRALGARKTTRKTRDELLAFVGMLTRMYDAHLCDTRRPQSDDAFALVVCVHLPDGATVSWQLCGAEEQARFRHLPHSENDSARMTQRDRVNVIDAHTPALRSTT